VAGLAEHAPSPHVGAPANGFVFKEHPARSKADMHAAINLLILFPPVSDFNILRLWIVGLGRAVLSKIYREVRKYQKTTPSPIMRANEDAIRNSLAYPAKSG
jgi:hypothetical protein